MSCKGPVVFWVCPYREVRQLAQQYVGYIRRCTWQMLEVRRRRSRWVCPPESQLSVASGAPGLETAGRALGLLAGMDLAHVAFWIFYTSTSSFIRRV